MSPQSKPIAKVSPSEPDRRMLFMHWAEPDVASGTPVILCTLYNYFRPNSAAIFCEENINKGKRREVNIEHPISKLRFQNWAPYFSRSSRFRHLMVQFALPLIVMRAVLIIARLKPHAIMAIYMQSRWIWGAYLASRLTGTPLIYYVHDTVRENTDRHGGLVARMTAWMEGVVLRSARVLVLHPYLAEHYERRYGIHCDVLRQVITREALPAKVYKAVDGSLIIGFSGAIYDNNSRQLADLAEIVKADSRLRLKIWTDASGEVLEGLGIQGDRVTAGYESNYERLLEQLRTCDLLYLPLAFHDTPTLSVAALQYAFPTKSLDYLVCGVPLLIHSPDFFELARFFQQTSSGHVLTDDGSDAVRTWLDNFASNRVPPLGDNGRGDALRMFSLDENKRLLFKIMDELSFKVDRASTSAAPVQN